MIKALLHALYAFFFVLLTGALAAWQLGEWTPSWKTPASTSPSSTLTPQSDQASSHIGEHGRIFVLFIESLRNETARNPDLMPYLSTLANRSLHGTMSTVYDAATEPALNAAFSGLPQKKALGALRVYFNPNGHLDSLFTVAKKNNLRSIIYSDYLTFNIFRKDFSERRQRSPLASTSTVEPSYSFLSKATQEFVDGDAHLMIYHIDELEAIAHKRGVEHQDYYEVAQTIDQLIREIDSRISPQDFFLIFGDHGHTLQGRHSLGLDVPTYFLLRGPQVIQEERPLSPITVIHHVITSTMRIPRSDLYEGPTWPLFQYQNTSEATPQTLTPKGYTPLLPREKLRWILISAVIGVLGVFWYQGNRVISHFFTPNASLATSRSLPLTQAPKLWARFLFKCLAGALVGVFFFFVGKYLSEFSTILRDPPLHMINKFWLAGLFLVLFNTPRRSPASLGLMIFLIPFFFLIPNFYRYGAPGVFAPAWILWGIGMGKLAYHKSRVKHRPYPFQIFYLLGVIVYILQLFFFAEGQKQTNSWFTPLISEITPTSVFVRSILAAAAGFFLIYRSHSALASKVVSCLFALHILLVQTHIIPHGGPVELLAAGTLLVTAILWSEPSKAGRYFKEPFNFPKAIYLVSLIVLAFEALRLNLDARVNLLLLFAAIRLSLILMKRVLDPYRSRENHLLFLSLVGLVGVGWLTLGWGFSRLDWAPLFDYVPPELVGRKMGHFLPLILVRFALPIVVVRTLIEEACDSQHPFPSTHLGLVLGMKYLSLLLIVLGIGFDQPGSYLYFEAVAQLGVFLILSFGFL